MKKKLEEEINQLKALNNYFIINTKGIEDLIEKYMIDESED